MQRSNLQSWQAFLLPSNSVNFCLVPGPAVYPSGNFSGCDGMVISAGSVCDWISQKYTFDSDRVWCVITFLRNHPQQTSVASVCWCKPMGCQAAGVMGQA